MHDYPPPEAKGLGLRGLLGMIVVLAFGSRAGRHLDRRPRDLAAARARR